jgi:hypothetical protein
MIEPSSLSPIESLVLARLLLAGEKGAKIGDLKKDLEPLLGHRWSGGELTAVLERTVIKLVSLALAAYQPVKSKRAAPAVALTEKGCRTALDFLRIDQLPTKSKLTWDKLKKSSLLLAPALGLAGPGSPLAKNDILRGVLLKTQYDLPLGELPTAKQAKEAWTRKALGMGEREKVTLDTIQAALFRRESGDHRATTPIKALDRLLAKRLQARRDDPKELRDEILRHWVDASLGKRPMGASPPGDSAASAPTLSPPLDLAQFARAVLAAACRCQNGRYGDNKVFIVHVWKAIQHDPGFDGMELAAFKTRLAEANNARLLDLSRADLVQAMNPQDVQLSEVSYLNATFHFIRVDSERH